MSKLDTLRDPLDGLSREELLERLHATREDRKISKYAITQKAARVERKKKTAGKKLADLMAGMDQEELAVLLADLGEEG